MKVDSEGAAFWKISKNKFGKTFDWVPINHFDPESNKPNKYVSLKNIWMKTYHVVLDPTLLPSMVFTRVRDELVQYGGVRLYRNGFRVVPYGEVGNDWLSLDQVYSRRTLLAPLANRNFFGVIDVRDTEGVLFEEHTSREGLIETLAFQELKGLLSSVLITAATRIHEERGRKTRAGGSNNFTPLPRRNPSSSIEKIETAARDVQSAAKKVSEENPSLASKEAEKNAAAIVSLVEEVKEDLKQVENHYADESSMLRFLATLGMTTAEFSHETGMTFEAFRFDFEKVFEAAILSNSDNSTFIEQARRARAMLLRLDALTSYLNNIAGARVARGMGAVSLSKAVESFVAGIKKQAESQDVSLEVRTPPFDPLFTCPMHEAEVASILLNFYTNSVKALKRSDNERKILVSVERDSENEALLNLCFSDSGDGVPDEYRERIFDPFFSSRVAAEGSAKDNDHARGTGLGLWIVKQIIDNAGGTVSLVQASPGYSTCVKVQLPQEVDSDE